MAQVENAGHTARPGTPQAAGFSFADFVEATQKANELARLAGHAHVNTRFERKAGESTDAHALRVQIDLSPRQWI